MTEAAKRAPTRRLPIIGTSDLAPLRPAGVIDGRQVMPVSDHEVLFSNEELLTPLQPTPGAWLPRIAGRTRYPIPDQVGRYGAYSEFVKAPKYMAQWVHWKERANLILAGRYHDVQPAHFEGIFTLVCNFMCPHCSRRVTRTKWVDGGTWEHNTEVEKKNTMDAHGLRRVIDQLAEHRVDEQMGIVWGGGDPTANPYTYDGMRYARSKGITSSFLTNGVFLDAGQCLDGDLARRKLERRARTLVGISLIVDERNLDDVVAAAELIRDVVDASGPGIDYVIARPVMNYQHFDQPWARLKDDTAQRALDLVTEGGEAWRIINDLDIPLVLIKDSFDPPPAPDAYNGGSCLSYGLYGEIRHNGDIQLCSDSYGNPEYTIGNIFENSLDEIWRSDRRREVLHQVNARECFKTACPHNSRGHHHNRVFHQIERLRQAGQMDLVRQWVDDLREVTYPLGHSFFV